MKRDRVLKTGPTISPHVDASASGPNFRTPSEQADERLQRKVRRTLFIRCHRFRFCECSENFSLALILFDVDMHGRLVASLQNYPVSGTGDPEPIEDTRDYKNLAVVTGTDQRVRGVVVQLRILYLSARIRLNLNMN
jgi:hypothetical protein